MKHLPLLGAGFLLLTLSIPPLFAGSMLLPGLGSTYNVEVDSYKELKFQNVIKQQYDFSCGSAAVATLLTYHYDYEVTEHKVFNEMFKRADREKVKREGFSMLDMKNYLESIDFLADGYRLPLEKLDQVVRVPAITIINTNGYNHFVVIKGVREGRVLVADPAVGTRVFEQEEFEQIWNGLVFLIRSHAEQGRLAYDTDSSWEAYSKANYASLLNNKNLAQFTLSLPRASEY
ncbi:C39 family peptidase [Aestuariicella sp. G3-2]|uniref:C39 family peptidase n=1 Tax=Pseudomaricurvus albidus TaxID=2842452 RepID=UPI001C0BFC7B|nr:C39 family peptidase [Aestuariicella albida]MBU3068972.1 C39 family peptidase [Aestuariicella albida]